MDAAARKWRNIQRQTLDLVVRIQAVELALILGGIVTEDQLKKYIGIAEQYPPNRLVLEMLDKEEGRK